MIPTIHLTNWSSRKLHHGHLYTIMARPRTWEHGAGRVEVLTPTYRALSMYQSRQMSILAYQKQFEDTCEGLLNDGLLAPGSLAWENDTESGPVVDGDTLCCSCSRAEAAAGRCHRVWAAPYLVKAGWRVILDGAEFAPKLEIP